ncbi:MAG: hypothetical protein AVDCRST_MAG49-1049 [uncultured Thermomicrobiales bacterium]|uniref:N-acetyltransferase domain-containing protein n=1 Tax=uncultured Thermomicrobiales bacterium TaxID=1645740 RepID=A0A6J4U7S1_9BACT|nr:MAG: hypothetical protein AVDCRST_MAG49-1049 [uncultured Thermomicrobiales bacterium]
MPSQIPVAAIDDETIAATIDASIGAYPLSFADLPDASVHRGPESTWLDAGPMDVGFSAVVAAHFDRATIDAQVAAVLAPFRRHGRAVTWQVGPSTRPADLGDVLLGHGLTHDEDEPGMAVKIERVPDAVAPPGLTIEPVRDARGLAEWVAVWLFPVPEDVRARAFDALWWRGVDRGLAWDLYLDRLDGTPVTTAEAFLGSDVAAVHHVVTLPAVRRRGIGAAMTRRVLRDAQVRGYQVGVLTASPDGIGTYRRMGFREFCLFRRFAWAPDAGPSPGEPRP